MTLKYKCTVQLLKCILSNNSISIIQNCSNKSILIIIKLTYNIIWTWYKPVYWLILKLYTVIFYRLWCSKEKVRTKTVFPDETHFPFFLKSGSILKWSRAREILIGQKLFYSPSKCKKNPEKFSKFRNVPGLNHSSEVLLIILQIHFSWLKKILSFDWLLRDGPKWIMMTHHEHFDFLTSRESNLQEFKII